MDDTDASAADRPSRDTFSVDTHLFRELGRLLVGRDSTALVELIKNAYDADAESVVVFGSGIQGDNGQIVVTDNGHGMNPEEFRRGFLRVAARSKDTATRRSRDFKRRYTGAKGIGRLSAHKLTPRLHVVSVPKRRQNVDNQGVQATLDWDVIEAQETLEGLTAGVQVEPTEPGRVSGTTITLSPLRRPWSDEELAALAAEAHTFRPPPMLVDRVPRELFPDPGLFDAIQFADVDSSDPGFEIHLAGDFEVGDSLWTDLVASMNWMIEIDASTSSVRYVISPSAKERANKLDARTHRFEIAHPDPQGPCFRARIFAHVGSYSGLSSFARQVGGVRVYMEGFRVLPYGEPSDDWLGIDSDYVRRNRKLRISTDLAEAVGVPTREVFNLLGNEQYVGAVLLTEKSAPQLEMLINREGFVPGPALDAVRQLVRQGIDLALRIRAAADDAKPIRPPKGSGRRPSATASAPPPRPTGAELVDRLKESTELAHGIRTSASPSAESISTLASALERTTNLAISEVDELRDEQARIRVLASVGTQLAGFVHEINSMLSQSRSLLRILDALARTPGLKPEQRSQLSDAQSVALELSESLARHGSYLSDVIVNEKRRRRRRHDVVDRLAASLNMLATAIDRRDITVTTDIQPKLRTPPMFGAEITMLLTNLLTNAIKAAGAGGRVAVVARQLDAAVELRIENTGEKVDLADSERWFRPFETTTTNVDVVLGQGMGLGLPITRALAADYGGTVEFVRPTQGYSTAVQVTLPDRARG